MAVDNIILFIRLLLSLNVVVLKDWMHWLKLCLMFSEAIKKSPYQQSCDCTLVRTCLIPATPVFLITYAQFWWRFSVSNSNIHHQQTLGCFLSRDCSTKLWHAFVNKPLQAPCWTHSTSDHAWHLNPAVLRWKISARICYATEHEALCKRQTKRTILS